MDREGVETSALWIMLAVSVFAFGLLWSGLKTRRWEGVLLIGIYVLYLWWVSP